MGPGTAWTGDFKEHITKIAKHSFKGLYIFFGFIFVMPFFVNRLVSSNIFFRCYFISSRGFNIKIVLTNRAIEVGKTRQVKDDR